MFLTIDVSDERINDLLFGHSGNYSSWLRSLRQGKGMSAIVKYDLENEDEGMGRGRQSISKKAIQKGLNLMATKAPWAFSQFMEENDDDGTFDIAWQYIIFGKEVYG